MFLFRIYECHMLSLYRNKVYHVKVMHNNFFYLMNVSIFNYLLS